MRMLARLFSSRHFCRPQLTRPVILSFCIYRQCLLWDPTASTEPGMLGVTGAHFVNLGAYEGPGNKSAQYKYPNGNYPHTVISNTQVLGLCIPFLARNVS